MKDATPKAGGSPAAGVKADRVDSRFRPYTRHPNHPDRTPMNPEDTIKVLKDALATDPENVKLRRHLAGLLAAVGRADEAAEEFRTALKSAPDDADLKLALVRVYLTQRKHSHAAVVLESLLARTDRPAEALVLMARIRLAEGDVPAAVAYYGRAVEEDPDVADPALSEQLGVTPGEEAAERSPVVEGRLRLGGADAGDASEGRVERPKIRFEDVGGMDVVKEEIDIKIIQPMLKPDLFAAYGKAVGGGILMYGPPGCGKTHLARATAGQVDASFLAVGLSDVLDMWVGQSERNLHTLFERARRSTPFVLFFDEVDALGASRSDLRQQGMRMVINQFLEELDGVKASNDGLLVLAATNAPWHLDSAFRRPGRFDRVIFVPPPDAEARAQILAVMLRGKPVGDVDFAKVAKRTEGFSGADLKGLIDVAVEEKLREAMKRGAPVPLVTVDLLAASKKVKPSTKDWFATARNYVLYSNEGGLYDDVARYLKI